MATVVSADVGIPSSLERRGGIVPTSIQKLAATVRVAVEHLNSIEDSLSDLRGTATSKVR